MNAPLAQFLSAYVFHTNRSPGEEQSFRQHLRATTLPMANVMLSVIILFLLATWPIDMVVYAGKPDVLSYVHRWRFWVLAPTIPFLIAITLNAWARRNVLWLVTVTLTVGLCGLASEISTLGGLDSPWFYSAYIMPFVSTFVGYRIIPRIAATLVIAGGICVGYFGSNPGHADYPYFFLVMNIFWGITMCAIAWGHVSYHISRENFFAKLELDRERAKTDRLLLNILPEEIADRLKISYAPIADGFADVTVLFADIVNFTAYASRNTPRASVDLLNRLFSEFDQVASRLGLEKIKTIGDAYMVAGGVPGARLDHTQAIAAMALEIQDIVARSRDDLGQPLQMRIGIHCGPIVAGVIGARKFIYDLWGDTVNTASRMESHGIPGEIQVTGDIARRLQGKYRFESRGVIDVKGKGPMEVHLMYASTSETKKVGV